MSYLYSEPEKYGLRMIGEVDFSDGCYQFDLTVIWQDVETGAYYYADDSGCSCPMPFESIGRDDLVRIDKPQQLIDHFEKRVQESYYLEDSETARDDVRASCGELVMKLSAVTP